MCAHKFIYLNVLNSVRQSLSLSVAVCSCISSLVFVLDKKKTRMSELQEE